MPSFTPMTLNALAYATAPLAQVAVPAEDTARDAVSLETTLAPSAADRLRPDGTPAFTLSAKPRGFVSRLLRRTY